MRSWLATAIYVLCVLVPAAAFAAPPVVKTVPADPNNALSLHDVISGRPTTLKGAADAACAGVCTWVWDPGDGSATISGNVDADPAGPSQLDDVGYNPYWAIWAIHTYTGNSGDVFIATLSVTNGPDTRSATYRVQIRDNVLSSEVNAAIDEALWHMHRNQFRFLGAPDTGAPGGNVLMGRWDYPQFFGTTDFDGNVTVSVSGASVNAFEANGYLESGPASSPYSETVALGLKYLFSRLATQVMDVQTVGDLTGNGRNDNPDTNGDGIGIAPNLTEQDPPYQSGMVMDAIVAAGTPATVTTTGPAGVVGLTYGKIIQDMSDWYAWAQSDSTLQGGWYYNAWDNNTGAHDNSASGWAAIGLVAARDIVGATIPDFVAVRNQNGLEFTDNESDTLDIDGAHGYTDSPGAIWGPFGVTGSAMVQMDLDDIASTTSAAPDERWVRSENYFRRHFNDPATGNNFKNYYYGMFNFAKAMRQAKPAPVIDIGTQVGAAEGGIGCGPSSNDTNGDGFPDIPDCGANGPLVLDWYNDPVNGLARTIVDYQILPGNALTETSCITFPDPGALPDCPNIGGFTDRPGNSQGSSQDDHNQPWATQILTRSLFQAGPIAQAVARPNPTGENVAVTFDPSGSFHQDPAHTLVLYEWDFDNDGTFDTSTNDASTVQHTFVCSPPGNLPCSFPVTLRVTDDNDPALTAEAVVVVDVTIPPHPPTAVSGGPYQVCVGVPTTLDGSGSFDIDEGDSEVGAPPDTITAYEWDLDLSSGAPFDTIDSTDIQPAMTFNTVGTFDIALRVTDNTALAYPTSGQPNLTNVDSTTLDVVQCPDIDLSLSATVDPSTTPLDTVSTMTFTVTNGGPDPTTGATLVLTVPVDLLVGSATPDTGTCTIFPDSVSCDLGVVGVGESVNVVMPVRSSVAGAYTVDGTVATTNLDHDTDLTNNDAAVTLIVLSGNAATSDLALTASADPPIFDPDATSNVTLTVSNNGPNDSSGAALSIDLPNSSLKALSATVDDGSCTIDNDVTCTLGPVAGGGSTDVHLVIAPKRNGDPTISAHVDPVGNDVDPDLSNNDASVSVTVRLEVVVKGKGGEGGVGLLELLFLAIAAPFMMWRRRMRGLGGVAALVLGCAIGAAAPPRAMAEGGGFYIGASAGQSSAGLSSDDYRNDLQSVGIDARNVSLDDSDTAWKAFAGYSFNEYFAVEGGYTNLGQMESVYTTTIDPGGEHELLRKTANVHPYFAAGGTLAVVGQVPIGTQFDLFAKVGGFWWDSSDVVVEIVRGSHGALALGKDGTDIFYGAGVGLKLGNGWKVKGEYERYEVDNQDCDFFSFGVEKHFGGQP